MEPLSHKHIYYIFQHNVRDGRVHRGILAKFALHDGKIQVLEDHGLEHDLKGLSPERACRYIHGLSRGQRTEVVCAEDVRQGHHPHLIPSTDRPHQVPQDLRDAISIPDPEKPQIPYSSFDYHRTGHPAPQHLEVHGPQPYLEGQKLAPEEYQTLVENIKSGRATLQHRPPPAPELHKIEKGLSDALASIKSLVASGHMHPDHYKSLTQQIFNDTMIPEMRNKMSYDDFMEQPREGVHIHLDGNDFGSINKVHGHETGDRAIKAMGKALVDSMDEAVGRKNGRLFRTGGDEFIAHVPTPEHAAAFSRALRTKLEAIPAVGGTHRLSMSVGYGHTKDHAEAGLQAAKAQKKLAGKPQGQAETHVVHQQPVAPETPPVTPGI